MTQWIKSLAAAACLLTLLLHLVPENRFAKYVRFYAGLLFFLLAVQPVLTVLGSDGELERLLQLEILKEEYYDLETAAEGLEDLKNEQIQKAFRDELERQAAGILSAYGFRVLSVEIALGEDGYSVESVSVVAETVNAASGDMDHTISAAVTELANLYQISESYVDVELNK